MSAEKSDLELRREKLAAMKAEREAKKGSRPAGAPATGAAPSPTRETTSAAAAPSATAAPSAAGSSLSSAPTDSMTASVVVSSGGTSNVVLTRVAGVGAINIAPPKVERHDRSEMTDTVYVSTEPIGAGGAAEGSAAQEATIRDLQAQLLLAKQEEVKHDREVARRSLFPVSTRRIRNGDATSVPGTAVQAAYSESVATSQFAEFAQRSSFILQRTLLSGVDLNFEGALGMTGADGTGRGGNQVATKQSTFLNESIAGKVVGSLSCQRGGEYFAVAYSSPPEADGSGAGANKGTVLVWSMRQSAVPVMEFSTSSDVTVVTYSPFHPHLLIAGCGNGRVVIWDVRKGSKPVDASFPSYEGHNGAAIVEAAVVGKQNHNTLVTVASDGHVCLWDVESPTFPSVSFDVISSLSTKPILTSAATIPASGLVRFYVGGTDGIVYKGIRSGASSSGHAEAKPIDNTAAKSTGTAGSGTNANSHVSTVTSMDCHPRLSKLVLSCSIDSTCRLSYDRSGESQQQQQEQPSSSAAAGGEDGGAAAATTSSTAETSATTKEERASSLAIENFSDFVYDAKWSPVHPGVFAAVDGSGTLTFWNILHSLSTPVTSAKLGGGGGGSSGDGGASSSGATALSAVCWTSDGGHVICGSSDGKTHLVAAAPELVHTTTTEVNAFSDLIMRTFGATSAISTVLSSATADTVEVPESA